MITVVRQAGRSTRTQAYLFQAIDRLKELYGTRTKLKIAYVCNRERDSLSILRNFVNMRDRDGFVFQKALSDDDLRYIVHCTFEEYVDLINSEDEVAFFDVVFDLDYEEPTEYVLR